VILLIASIQLSLTYTSKMTVRGG